MCSYLIVNYIKKTRLLLNMLMTVVQLSIIKVKNINNSKIMNSLQFHQMFFILCQKSIKF